MKTLDGISVVAMLTIAAFAIDRVLAAIFFLVQLAKPELDPASPEVRDPYKLSRKLKIFYTICAAILATAVVVFLPVRILGVFGVSANDILDAALTAIVLMGGSDQLASLLKTVGVPEPESATPAPQPVEISGRIMLEEAPAKVRVQQAS